MARCTRTLLGCLMAFGVALGAAPAAHAQAPFPSKPVTIVVGYPPGGPTDIYARVLAKALSDYWKQPVIVENKAGASGTIGATQVLRSAPDGYTLYFSNNATNGAIELLQPKTTPFRTLKDFAPVAMFGISPSLMVVRTSLGTKDVKEFIALAKKEPGKVTYASSAIGSAPHLDGELFQAATGTKLLHVPYNGAAPIIQALLGDTVDMYVGGASTVMPNVKTGKLTILGAAHPTRLQSAPDVPTLGEQGIKGVDSASWFGLLAPAQTPPAVLDQINADARKVMEAPDGKAQIEKLGIEYESMSRQQFQNFLKNEIDRTAKIVAEQKLATE